MFISKLHVIDEQMNRSYCIIRILKKNLLVLSCYKFCKNLCSSYIRVDFVGSCSQIVCKLIYFHFAIYNHISCSHALYLGRELSKAELCMVMGQTYIQD